MKENKPKCNKKKLSPANITSLIVKKFTCYIGSEWPKGLLFFLFLTIKLIIEFVFVINIKTSSDQESILLSIISFLLFFINIILCFKCLIGNPGILPANPSYQTKPPISKKLKWFVLKGRVYRLKKCPTCFIVRLIGSGHCKKCNVCIERYDHHCPWVGSCIGRNNYKYFFFLLISLNLYFILSVAEDIICFIRIYDCIKNNTVLYYKNCRDIFAYDLVTINDNNTKIEYKAIVKANMFISIFFAILNFIGLLFVFVLLIRHIIYLIHNETTYLRVKMRNILKVYGNHFDKGILNNIKAILFSSFMIRKNKKVKFPKGIAKVNTYPKHKINESNFPINVSYNCYVSYNSKGLLGKNQTGSMIQIKNNDTMLNKSPKINNSFSNISKSFEEDLYSQHNTLFQCKNDNASSIYQKSKNGSVNDRNILKPNVFFANHEEDGNGIRLPNAISTNLEYNP